MVERAIARAVEAPGRLPFLPGTHDYHATRQAFVLFVGYVGVFYLAASSVKSRSQMSRLLTGVAVFAGFVALYGLFEFLAGGNNIFGWKEHASERLRGTLVNPDHFAGYLGMAIPLAIASLIAIGAKRRRRHRSHHDSEGEGQEPSSARHSQESEEEPTGSLLDRQRRTRPYERESRRLLLGLGCAAMIAALVFTMSRGGIIGFLAGSLVFVGLLWIRESGYRRRLTGMGIALAAVILILWIGAEPIFERFGLVQVDSVDRMRLYQETFRMARDFPILGTGLGTFERAFLPYVFPDFTFDKIVSHAHNEWLQLLAEGGLLAFLLLLLALFLLLRDLLLRPIFGLGQNHKFAIRNVGSTTKAWRLWFRSGRSRFRAWGGQHSLPPPVASLFFSCGGTCQHE